MRDVHTKNVCMKDIRTRDTCMKDIHTRDVCMKDIRIRDLHRRDVRMRCSSKMHFRTERNRDGVSPVIGTILMVALTVSLAAVVYLWAVGFDPGSQVTPKGLMSVNGNPDTYFTATVRSMDGTLKVEEARYYLVNDKGTTVESGKVSDIYGKDGNVRFNDVDGDREVTPDDNFRLKGEGNGGKCGSGYKFTIKFTGTNEVVMSGTAP